MTFDPATLTTTYAVQTGAAARARVLSAIEKASAKTGVDFSYLVQKASQESSFDPAAQAKTSTATGLYQFVEQTWLRTIKAHGAEHGLSAVAQKISIGADGLARAASEADRKAILALRNDPEISANMAAALAKDNKDSLQKSVGGQVGATEMYLAHFLGAGGAAQFLKTMKVNPQASAAAILPTAAGANPNVFYDKKTGTARSLEQIYAMFEKKFDGAGEGLSPKTRLAASGRDGREALGAVAVSSANPARGGGDEISLARLAGAAGAVGPISEEFGASSATNEVTLRGGVKLGATASTPFAAMMLAQMDMENFGLEALSRTRSLPDDAQGQTSRRRAIASALGQMG